MTQKPRLHIPKINGQYFIPADELHDALHTEKPYGPWLIDGILDNSFEKGVDFIAPNLQLKDGTTKKRYLLSIETAAILASDEHSEIGNEISGFLGLLWTFTEAMGLGEDTAKKPSNTPEKTVYERQNGNRKDDKQDNPQGISKAEKSADQDLTLDVEYWRNSNDCFAHIIADCKRQIETLQNEVNYYKALLFPTTM